MAQLARHTRIDKLPSVLDFGFAGALQRGAGGRGAAPRCWRACTPTMALYEGGVPAALRLPTFTGNHDFGRFAYLVRQARPTMPRRGSPAARAAGQCHDVPAARRARGLLRRRAGFRRPWHRPGGTPGHVREPGGELQRPGVVGHGVDHGAGQLRCLASHLPADRRARHAGASNTRRCAAVSRWCARSRRRAGLFAASRIGSDGREILLAFNTSNAAITAQVEIESEHARVHCAARRMSDAQCTRHREGSTASRWDSLACVEVGALRRALRGLRPGVARGIGGFAQQAAPQPATVRSPNQAIEVELRVDGRRASRIQHRRQGSHAGRLVAARIHPRGCSPSSSAISPSSHVAQRSFDDTWEQPWGERRYVRNHGNEMRVSLREKAGASSSWCFACSTTASVSATSSRSSRSSTARRTSSRS